MTKLKSMIPIFVFAILATTTFANTTTEAAQQEIRKEIAKRLQNIDLTQFNVNEATIQLTFLVNDQNEIVVLSTDNPKFDTALKSRLNYKYLKVNGSTVNQIYSVPIVLKS